MENLKYTKEYAELEAKKAYFGTKNNNNEIETFTYGYLHCVDKIGAIDMLEALIESKSLLMQLKDEKSEYYNSDLKNKIDNTINKATK